MNVLRASAAVIALIVVTACGASDDSPSPDEPATSTSAPEPSAAPVKKSAACSLLTAADRKKLLGAALDSVVASDAREDAAQCRWANDKGLIQVTSLSAEDWAKTLPEVVAQMEKSADPSKGDNKSELARAKKLLAGADTFTGAQACAAFETLAEIGGSKPGTHTTLSYLPISQDEVGISSQTCTAGRLTSIVFSAPKMTKAAGYEAKVATALQAAHRRATR